ncbi:MAG: hypothetical protein K8S54_14400 [Spirochaetia bacterium]|nr:hypothetical protein [Spirochaetia bacterium]
MFYFLYNAILTLLWPIYILGSLFISKVRDFRRSRITLDDFANLNPESRPLLWLHAASVGELDQALAVSREFRASHPGVRIVVSVFSMSVKKLESGDVDFMFRLPVDFYWSWSALIDTLRPNALVTFTWDVFPNLLLHLEKKKIPAYLSCAALSADSSRLKFPMRILMRSVYKKLAGIGAVDTANLARFQKLTGSSQGTRDQAITRIEVTGDSRYDAIFHKIENAKLSPEIESRLKLPGRTWILASTYAACDAVIFPHLESILREFVDLNVLVFPHFVDEKRLRAIEEGLRRYSLNSSRFTSGENTRVRIVDQLGVLALAYRYATFAYVGGGFHHRIHNTGEPAAFALPILTGPRIETSPVALLLEKEGALVRINSQTLNTQVKAWLADDSVRLTAGRGGQDSLKRERGSARKFTQVFLDREFSYS